MPNPYDKYYKTKNLFGDAYPELLDFLSLYPNKGKVLDLGCGQGRDALAIARLGFTVTGIDNSEVGITQMNKVAKSKNLTVVGLVADIFTFNKFEDYDFILLDSMFHFTKNDRNKETDFIENIISNIKTGTIVIFCIQDTGKKVTILNTILEKNNYLSRVKNQLFSYTFKDNESGHNSVTPYQLIAIEK